MKNKIITISYLVVLFSFLFVNTLTPNQEISDSERRKLAVFPALSAESLYDGKFMKDFEKYALDHFIWRQGFRSAKSVLNMYVLRKQDTNDIYLVDGQVLKIEYPLRHQSIINLAAKYNEIYDMYLKDMSVYYALIPDKNYFVAESSGRPALDYALMESILRQNVTNMNYINLFDVLDINDYYRTDLHWKQENLSSVVDRLAEVMNFAVFDGEFTEHEYYPFYGAYYGQAALPLEPDRLIYLTNTVIDGAKVENYDLDPQRPACNTIYDTDRLGGIDSYDVFLSGPTFLTVITNEDAAVDRELIIFRDSFTSSLAPLLLGGYSKITLVDLRYVSYKELSKFIEFGDQDVLFVVCVQIANNSVMLK